MRLLAISLVVLAAAAPAGSAAVSPPQLKIEGTRPVVVSGRGFDPSERITLRISGGNVPRLVRADMDGSFRIQLGSLRTLRCAAFIVTASGASGLKASAHLPRPACLTQHTAGSTQ